MVEGSGGGGPSWGPGQNPRHHSKQPAAACGSRWSYGPEKRQLFRGKSFSEMLIRASSIGPAHQFRANLSRPNVSLLLSPAPPPPLAPSSSKQPTEAEPKDSQAQAGSNRLSTVIERIERMYAGNGSSGEEDVVLDNIPDDDEYDTEDSFIDDAELDDYFQVENLAIKHDGFFVNRGKLEPIEPTICTNQQPKKRRRKDLMQGHGGSDDGHNPNKIVKVGNRGRKRNSTSQSHGVSMPNIHGVDMQFQVSLPNASEVSLKKKTRDMPTVVHPSELLNGDAIREDTETDLQIPGDPSSKNHITKWKESEFQDTSTQRSNDKNPHLSKPHTEKQLYNIDDLDQSTQQKEKSGVVERFDLNIPASRDSLPTM
ncbi:UNVERIFIED_CONTAM: Ubinuclein-1 [Sesamum angustifolium]|uniref:Ubinuclein-1 n=1 Tax=Sesamum angustifolium TaxID=2727405 RepID=A0AAW2LVD3_9LAMI